MATRSKSILRCDITDIATSEMVDCVASVISNTYNNVMIYRDLYSALFILGCPKALYAQNKDSYIKHANTAQIHLN